MLFLQLRIMLLLNALNCSPLAPLVYTLFQLLLQLFDIHHAIKNTDNTLAAVQKFLQ